MWYGIVGLIAGAVIGYFMAALTKTAKTYSEEER